MDQQNHHLTLELVFHQSNSSQTKDRSVHLEPTGDRLNVIWYLVAFRICPQLHLPQGSQGNSKGILNPLYSFPCRFEYLCICNDNIFCDFAQTPGIMQSWWYLFSGCQENKPQECFFNVSTFNLRPLNDL